MKGVAAEDPPRAEVAALEGAEAFDARRGVTAARGMEAADVPEQRRERHLVEPDEAQEEEPEAALEEVEECRHALLPW